MTRLDFIARRTPGAPQNLTLEEIKLNKQLARNWRLANPDFFAVDPATLPQRKAKGAA